MPRGIQEPEVEDNASGNGSADVKPKEEENVDYEDIKEEEDADYDEGDDWF